MMLNQPQAWFAPPDQPVLGARDVHVWLASLDQSVVVLRRLAEHLSADERTRGERFRFDEDRRNYIVARGETLSFRKKLTVAERTASGTVLFAVCLCKDAMTG